MTYFFLIISTIAAVAFWFWLYRNKMKSASRVTVTSDFNKYHCVAIIPGNKPCDLVKRLKGKRFLSTEAPILKLDECTAESCQCRYIHYDDRREDERHNPYGRYRSTNLASIYKERREMSGRRYTDVVKHDDGMPDLNT